MKRRASSIIASGKCWKVFQSLASKQATSEDVEGQEAAAISRSNLQELAASLSRCRVLCRVLLEHIQRVLPIFERTTI